MGEDMTSFWTDIKLFEGVLERDPDSYAFIPLSELYRKLGLFEDALSVAQRGCSRHPSLVAGQLALGLACHELGLKDDCRVALEQVVSVTPENIDAQRVLSRMYADAGDYAAAESSLRIILALAPNDLESRVIQEALSRAKGFDESGVYPDPVAVDEAELTGEHVAVTPFERSLADADVREKGDTLVKDLSDQDDYSAGFEFGAEEEEILELDDDSIIEELDDIVPEEDTPKPDTGRLLSEQAPVVSATMAELYVKQGFNDLAIGVYRQLLAESPTNTDLLLRLDELLAVERNSFAVSPVTESYQTEAIVREPSESSTADRGCEDDLTTGADPSRQESLAILEDWLESIRRVKACRSSLH